MIGHLFTLLFVRAPAPPQEEGGAYVGGGGGETYDFEWRDRQIRLNIERAANAEAIEIIGALVAIGVIA